MNADTLIYQFELDSSNKAVSEIVNNFLKSVKDIKNLNIKNKAEQDELIADFKESLNDIKALKDGDKSVLYEGSFSDMMKELRSGE
jgi:vacuolar-type H+-ATPase subunit C/Vma6